MHQGDVSIVKMKMVTTIITEMKIQLSSSNQILWMLFFSTRLLLLLLLFLLAINENVVWFALSHSMILSLTVFVITYNHDACSVSMELKIYTKTYNVTFIDFNFYNHADYSNHKCKPSTASINRKITLFTFSIWKFNAYSVEFISVLFCNVLLCCFSVKSNSRIRDTQ